MRKPTGGSGQPLAHPATGTAHGSGAYGVLVRLTHKAAPGCGKIDYWAGAVAVGVSYKEDGPAPGGAAAGGRPGGGCRTARTRRTPAVVAELWNGGGGRDAFKVGMVLSDLIPARSADGRRCSRRTAGERPVARDGRRETASSGRAWSTSGNVRMKDAAPNRIAFTQIPDFDRPVN